MVGEAIAGLSAVKTAFDIAKTLKDMDNAATRNAAVIELQEKILAAREHQTALLDRIGTLEAEVTRLETWNAEKQRYELQTIGDGAVAYMLKPNARGTEPPHWLCPNCYSQGKKAFYQPTGARLQRASVYRCQGCQGNISVESEPAWLTEKVSDESGGPKKRKVPGENCPRCRENEFRLERSEPHPIFGDMGGRTHHMKCDSCGFTDEKLITP